MIVMIHDCGYTYSVIMLVIIFIVIFITVMFILAIQMLLVPKCLPRWQIGKSAQTARGNSSTVMTAYTDRHRSRMRIITNNDQHRGII